MCLTPFGSSDYFPVVDRDDLHLWYEKALPILKEDSPLPHQNQPPEG